MIIALHHTGIATRDLDRLSNFYMKLFSGEILHSFAWDRSDVALSARLGLKSSSGRLVMIGFPNETWDSIEKTIEAAIYLNPDVAVFPVVTPMPFTPIFEEKIGRAHV